MSDNTNIKADISNAKELLEGLELSSKTIQKKLLTGFGQGALKQAKKEYRGTLKKRSGALYKGMHYKVQRKSKGVTLYAKADTYWNAKGRYFNYANALVGGPSPHVKESQNLTFQINGKWVSVKQTRSQPHDLYNRPVNRYLGSEDYKVKSQKVLQREIARLTEKAAREALKD